MPGKGKYSLYVSRRDAKSHLYERLFPGTQKITPPYKGLSQGQAVTVANDMGDKYLRGGDSGVQQGDPMTMGNVAIDYSGAPDTAKIEWKNPGDPINGYLPDITSPGPGKVAGTDKDHVGDDAKALKEIPGQVKSGYVASEDSRSPSETSNKVHDNNSFTNSKMTYAKSGA